jgi:hypothetical protein
LEADRILTDKGVFIIPDILANSGGVIVSYFEWVQDVQRFFWKAKDIQDRLQDIITSAFHRTLRFLCGETDDDAHGRIDVRHRQGWPRRISNAGSTPSRMRTSLMP